MFETLGELPNAFELTCPAARATARFIIAPPGRPGTRTSPPASRVSCIDVLCTGRLGIGVLWEQLTDQLLARH